MKKLTLFLLLWVLFLLIPHGADATFEFFDGKLRVKGRFEQYIVYNTQLQKDDLYYKRRTSPAVNQSIFALEGLYTLVDNGEWLVNFQNYLRYYYESAPDMDSHLRRAFSTRRRMHKKYQTNRYDSDDWINEMYLDIYKGPWNIRLGKQVVAWSEVEMVQTIDKINPIDLRYATPGIQPFDEIKLGLWMFRGFYNSDLPGNLIFEHIFIPGDFERTRTPFEGTWASRRPAPGQIKNAPGQGDAVYWMMDQAMPQFALNNYQYAFRVRGNSEVFLFKTPYIIDWTVTYWNGLDTGHATFTDTERVNEALSQNAPSRVGAVRPDHLCPMVGMWLPGNAMRPLVPPSRPMSHPWVVFCGVNFPMRSAGSGIQVDPYAEGTAPRHPPRRVGDVGLFADRTIARDFFSYGITIDKPFCVPFYGNRMQRWGVRPCWDITLGVFGGYFLGDYKRIWQWSSGYGYRVQHLFYHDDQGRFPPQRVYPRTTGAV